MLSQGIVPGTVERSRFPVLLGKTLRVLVVAGATAIAYANSLDAPLQFDDIPSIGENVDVHASELTIEQMRRAAKGFPLRRWLVYVSFAANHAIHGTSPLGFHVANLVFHVGSALLVLALSLEILAMVGPADRPERWNAATFAALLFATHPVQTQAVTYVVQRMTSMGAFFGLLSVWLWLFRRRSAGRRRGFLLVASVVAAILALGCKENFVVLPGIVLVIEWVVDLALGERIRRQWRVWAVTVAGAVSAGIWLLTVYWNVIVQEHARFGIPVAHRLLSQGRILFHYLSLLALPFPSRLHVDYAYIPSTGLVEPPSTALGLVGLAALLAVAVWARMRVPLLSLAVGWFFVALLVEQTVLPLDLVFEHRLYFASTGIFLAAGAAMERWLRVPRLGAWPVAAAVGAALVLGTIARNEVWRNPLRWLLDPEAIGPASARTLFSAGTELRKAGRYDDAERVLRRAIEFYPNDPSGYVNLGNLELERGRHQVAERWYHDALARAGPHPEIFYNLGVLYERQGRWKDAVRAYETALAIYPALTDARINLGVLLEREEGDQEAALAAYNEALRLAPGSAPALANRALLLSSRGEHARALSDAMEARRLGGEHPGVLGALALVQARAGRHTEARISAREALRLDPSNAEAAKALAATGDR